MFARLLGTAALVLSLAPSASAALITYNLATGQGTPGSIDPNYKIISSPLGALNATINTTPDGTFPIPPWILTSADAGSKWIVPSATGNAAQNFTNGLFTYQTQFDLTGLVPNTASLSLGVAADNQFSVLLNGNVIGGNPNPGAFSAFTPISTSNPAFFINGINTLQFVVQNGNTTDDLSGPTGLRVSGASSVSAQVPEPATLAVFGLGLAGVGGYIRRRKAVATA